MSVLTPVAWIPGRCLFMWLETPWRASTLLYISRVRICDAWPKQWKWDVIRLADFEMDADMTDTKVYMEILSRESPGYEPVPYKYWVVNEMMVPLGQALAGISGRGVRNPMSLGLINQLRLHECSCIKWLWSCWWIIAGISLKKAALGKSSKYLRAKTPRCFQYCTMGLVVFFVKLQGPEWIPIGRQLYLENLSSHSKP